MNWIRKATISLLLLLSACWAMAQPYYSVRTFDIHDGLAANTISGIDQSPNGLMWIATWNGLCCYDGYQFTTFRSDNWTDADALSSNRISAIKPDSRENVWVRTYDGGLYLLDTRQCRFVNVGILLERKYGKTIHPRNFYAMKDGHTWISDEQGDMNLRIDDRYPIDVERIEVIDLHKYPKAGQYIRKVEDDGNHREWLITDKGKVQYGHWDKAYPLSEKDEVNQPDTTFIQKLEACGINAADIDKHFTDRQGNLWLTSTRGLTLVNMLHTHMLWTPLVASQETRSLLSRQDGTIWAGSKDGYIGVYACDGKQLGWLNPQGKVVTANTRFANHIYAMKEDSQGHTWIGTKGQGLYVVGPQGAVRHYMPDTSNPYAINSDAVYDIDEDAQGNIWIGTYGGGLNVANIQADGTLRFLHSGNELKGYPIDKFKRVRRITHNRNGVVVLSCTEGLVTFSNRDRRFFCTQHHRQDTTSLRANDVLQTLITHDGHVYVTTLGGGIQQIVSDNLLQDNLQFKLMPKMDQGAGYCLSLTEDTQGTIWITREAEVCKYFKYTDLVERFTPHSQTGHNILTEGGSVIDQEGHLWVAATGGMYMLDTKQTEKSTFHPNIIFTSLLFQGEQEARPILNRQTLTIDRNQRNLTIRFAALDYSDHFLTEYAYCLDDAEEWNYIGATPRISFNQLSPGMHTLRVRSTNADGVWGSQEATLYLDVTPTLWERTWVRIAVLLLTIIFSTAAILDYIRYRQKNREREKRLENILQQYRELQQTVGTVENGELRTESCDMSKDCNSSEQSNHTSQFSVHSSQLNTSPHHYRLETPHVIDEDQQMMQQLMKFIEEHVDDDGLRIDDMAQAVGLGRSVFYERLKALVGVSPIDFLRQLRMQRAKELIKRSSMNVSQVAYAVGFTDPKYFTKCFKKETGMTPSEYRDVAKNDEV